LAAPPLALRDFTLFLIGAISMRGAGCVINDLTDQKFDRAVERTKTRPLITGAVTPIQAVFLFGLLCLIGLGVFSFLTQDAKILALIAFCLLLIYPWMKRITHWPQFVLGLAFNSGVLIAWANAGKSLGNYLPWCFYGIGILWTLAYDTVYAFQDIEDDLKVGVQSTAILFQKTPKLLPGSCFLLMGACFIGAGIKENWSLPYFGCIAGVIAYGVILLAQWNPKEPTSSLHFFKANQWLGLGILLALLLKD